MKKRLHGPSLYYATDKNVFDALNQHKVDTATVIKLFERRNIVVGKRTPREDLAAYFARLTHDYHDHQDIAARLGIAPRRERTTSMDVKCSAGSSELQSMIEQLKKDLEADGDVVQVTRENENFVVHVQYSTIDYKRSEFAQVQARDGSVEFVKTDDGYIVRNTQNEYINNVRETLLTNLEKAVTQPITKIFVSLFDVPSPHLRSKFFHELVNDLPGYTRRDVTDVYIYKAKPTLDDDDGNDSDDDTPETHVERVLLRGNGVSRSELLNELLEEEDYYITKIGWTAAEKMGVGNVYDIEAVFSDPKDCAGFSFILSGVYPLEKGKKFSRRRAPFKNEIAEISLAVEEKARELISKLRNEYATLTGGI